MQQDKTSFEQDCAAFMQAGQKGDQQAYRSLLQALTPFLRRVIAGRISANGDVEDIVQEILLSLHKARATYHSDRPFLPWLMAIMHYRLMDYFRKSYRGAEQRSSLSYDEVAQKFSETAGADSVTDNDIRLEYIENAMTTLPDKQQKILTLLHIEGFTSKEAAEKLGMTTSAVKVSAHRAYKRIRATVEEQKG